MNSTFQFLLRFNQKVFGEFGGVAFQFEVGEEATSRHHEGNLVQRNRRL